MFGILWPNDCDSGMRQVVSSAMLGQPRPPRTMPARQAHKMQRNISLHGRTQSHKHRLPAGWLTGPKWCCRMLARNSHHGSWLWTKIKSTLKHIVTGIVWSHLESLFVCNSIWLRPFSQTITDLTPRNWVGQDRTHLRDSCRELPLRFWPEKFGKATKKYQKKSKNQKIQNTISKYFKCQTNNFFFSKTFQTISNTCLRQAAG